MGENSLESRGCLQGQVTYDTPDASCRLFYLFIKYPRCNVWGGSFGIGNISRSNAALMVFGLSDFPSESVISESQGESVYFLQQRRWDILLFCKCLVAEEQLSARPIHTIDHRFLAGLRYVALFGPTGESCSLGATSAWSCKHIITHSNTWVGQLPSLSVQSRRHLNLFSAHNEFSSSNCVTIVATASECLICGGFI